MIYPRSTTSNLTIRVAIVRNAPDVFDNCHRYPTYFQTLNCEFPGYTLEIMAMISNYLNISIVPYLVPTMVDVGRKVQLDDEQSMWSGVLGLINNRTVDTATLMYQRTPTRNIDFDFAYSVMSVYNFDILFIDGKVRPVFITTRYKPSHFSNVSLMYRMFNINLWIVIFISIILQIIAMMIVDKVEYYLRQSYGDCDIISWQPLQLCWQLFRFICLQGHGSYRRITYGGNLQMTIFGFAIVLILSLYQGLLLTQLLNPPQSLPFSDAHQLIQLITNRQYRLLTNYDADWYFDNLYHSNMSHFVAMRQAIVHNPIAFASNISHALKLLSTGDYIYPTQEDSILPAVYTHFVFAKANNLSAIWNRAIIQLQAFQIRTFNKYFVDGFRVDGRIAKCSEATNNIDSKRTDIALNIDTLLGVCLLYLCGIISSLISYLFERQRNQGKQQHEQPPSDILYAKRSGRLSELMVPMHHRQQSITPAQRLIQLVQ